MRQEFRRLGLPARIGEMAERTAVSLGSDDGRASRFDRVAEAAGLFVSVIALVVPLIWGLGAIPAETLTRLGPVMPVTAAGLFLSGASLWLLGRRELTRMRRGIGIALAAAVTLLGMFVLSAHVFGFDARIGALPSAATAISLAAVGLALLLLDTETRSGLRPAQVVVLIPAFLGIETLVGYGYGQALLTETQPTGVVFTPMAVLASVCFIALATGVFSARGKRGLIALFAGDETTVLIARRLLPAALIVPPLLGWVRLVGERAGLYDSTTGDALFVVAIMLAFTILVGWSAAVARRLDLARRRAESALRDNEERYRSVYERSGIGIVVADSSGRATMANPAFHQFLGYPADELKGMSMARVTHPDDIDMERNLFLELVAGTRDSYLVEKRYIRKDGSIVWGRMTGTMLHPAAGLAIGMVEDVTERQELEQERARLTAVVDATPDFIGTARADGPVMTLNPAARRMLGIGPSEDAESLMMSDLHPADAFARVRNEGIPAAIRDGEWYGETAILDRDGHEIPVSQVILAHRGSRGEVEFLSTIIRDISGRLRREQDERLLLDASRVLTGSLDEDEVLHALAELLARQRADYSLVDRIDVDGPARPTLAVHRRPEGQRILDELTAHVRTPDVHPGVSAVLRTGESQVIERVTDESLASAAVNGRHVELLRELGVQSHIIVPLRSRDHVIGALTVGCTTTAEPFDPQDVTLIEEIAARTAVAIENYRLYRKSREATRTRDEVLRVVAHDLRNPLSTIGLAAGIVTDALPPSMHDERRQMDIVLRSAGLANRLIQDLLDVARMQAGKLTVEAHAVDSVDLTAEAVELNRALADDKSLEIDSDIPDGLPQVQADRGRVLQVFSNLIGNAIKFTPEGGRIGVRAEKANGSVRFFVSDTGPGIPDEARAHLFDPFWQATRDVAGAGLGLSLAKGIVEAHGGKMDLQSERGAGATFRFTIPTADPNSTDGGRSP